MSARSEAILWLAQRASAVLLAFCVLVHLVTVIVAVQGGLSATEILGRTRGNVPGLVFYSAFVIAAAVHAPIGLRATLSEWLGWRGVSRDVVLALFALALAVLGLRAVTGVFGGAA
jgi:fumarate reductase subunit C